MAANKSLNIEFGPRRLWMDLDSIHSGGLDWTFGGLPMRDFQAMLGAIPQTPEYLAYANAHWDELIEPKINTGGDDALAVDSSAPRRKRATAHESPPIV